MIMNANSWFLYLVGRNLGRMKQSDNYALQNGSTWWSVCAVDDKISSNLSFAAMSSFFSAVVRCKDADVELSCSSKLKTFFKNI